MFIRSVDHTSYSGRRGHKCCLFISKKDMAKQQVQPKLFSLQAEMTHTDSRYWQAKRISEVGVGDEATERNNPKDFATSDATPPPQ